MTSLFPPCRSLGLLASRMAASISRVTGTHKHSGRTVAVIKERGDGRKPDENHHWDNSLCELIKDDGTHGKLVWVPKSSLRSVSEQDAARLTASWVQPAGAASALRGPLCRLSFFCGPSV